MGAQHAWSHWAGSLGSDLSPITWEIFELVDPEELDRVLVAQLHGLVPLLVGQGSQEVVYI